MVVGFTTEFLNVSESAGSVTFTVAVLSGQLEARETIFITLTTQLFQEVNSATGQKAFLQLLPCLQISRKVPYSNKHVFKVFTRKEKMHTLNSFTNICPCSLSGLHSYIRVAGIGCRSQKCHSQHNNHQ